MEKGNLTYAFKLARYKIITINNIHYLIDADKKITSFIFPFLQWVTPSSVFVINDDIKEKLQNEVINKQISKIYPTFLGLIGIAIGRTLYPYFMAQKLEISKIYLYVLTLILYGFLISVRVKVSLYSKCKINQILDFNKLEKRKILILPNSIALLFRAAFMPIILIIMAYVGAYAFITQGIFMMLIAGGGLFCLVLIQNLFPFEIGDYNIIFLKK